MMEFCSYWTIRGATGTNDGAIDCAGIRINEVDNGGKVIHTYRTMLSYASGTQRIPCAQPAAYVNDLRKWADQHVRVSAKKKTAATAHIEKLD
jgi:LSD1 subclass zinc finger protein